MIGKACDIMKELLYPRHCPVCDEIVRPKDGLCCRECRDIFQRVEPPRCIKCGKHVDASENQMLCYDCSRAPKHFERGFSLFEYASVHDSVHMFKNRGRCEYADYYARCIYETFGDKIRETEADAIIPIPLHPSKQKKRGYNQASLLAKQLGGLCKIPVREDVLFRLQRTAVQKHLNHTQRQNNMKKAFHIDENDVKLNKIILVDDVYTTGNTIEAAARVLQEHGVKSVFFVTLAVGFGR